MKGEKVVGFKHLSTTLDAHARWPFLALYRDLLMRRPSPLAFFTVPHWGRVVAELEADEALGDAVRPADADEALAEAAGGQLGVAMALVEIILFEAEHILHAVDNALGEALGETRRARRSAESPLGPPAP